MQQLRDTLVKNGVTPPAGNVAKAVLEQMLMDALEAAPSRSPKRVASPKKTARTRVAPPPPSSSSSAKPRSPPPPPPPPRAETNTREGGGSGGGGGGGGGGASSPRKMLVSPARPSTTQIGDLPDTLLGLFADYGFAEADAQIAYALPAVGRRMQSERKTRTSTCAARTRRAEERDIGLPPKKSGGADGDDTQEDDEEKNDAGGDEEDLKVRVECGDACKFHFADLLRYLDHPLFSGRIDFVLLVRPSRRERIGAHHLRVAVTPRRVELTLVPEDARYSLVRKLPSTAFTTPEPLGEWYYDPAIHINEHGTPSVVADLNGDTIPTAALVPLQRARGLLLEALRNVVRRWPSVPGVALWQRVKNEMNNGNQFVVEPDNATQIADCLCAVLFLYGDAVGMDLTAKNYHGVRRVANTVRHIVDPSTPVWVQIDPDQQANPRLRVSQAAIDELAGDNIRVLERPVVGGRGRHGGPLPTRWAAVDKRW